MVQKNQKTGLVLRCCFISTRSHIVKIHKIGVNLDAYKENDEVHLFYIGRKDISFEEKPNLEDENWDFVVYSNSDWAGDVKNNALFGN